MPHDIDIYTHPTKPNMLSALTRCRHRKELRLHFNPSHTTPGCQVCIFDRRVASPRCRYRYAVAYDKGDASAVWSRALVKDPSISAVIRTAVLKPEYRNESAYYWHERLLGGQPAEPPLPLHFTEDEYARVVPGPHYAAYPVMNGWADIKAAPALKDRQPVIHCTMRMKGYTDVIRRHRHTAAVKCQALPMRLEPPAEYRNHMLNSLVVVSPFGHGELCYRDFEAMFAGALLIKPSVEHMTIWRDTLVSCDESLYGTYVPCRLDFSDVPQILRDVQQRPQAYQVVVERAWHAVREAHSIDALEKWLLGLLKMIGAAS